MLLLDHAVDVAVQPPSDVVAFLADRRRDCDILALVLFSAFRPNRSLGYASDASSSFFTQIIADNLCLQCLTSDQQDASTYTTDQNRRHSNT